MNNFLRLLAKIGIVLLALLMFVSIYFGVQADNWWGVFVCTGFLAILAHFYDVFRVQALREKMPCGSFSPNKKIHGILYFVLGFGAVMGGGAQFWVGSYWGGGGLLTIGFVVLSEAINVFRGRL